MKAIRDPFCLFAARKKKQEISIFLLLFHVLDVIFIELLADSLYVVDFMFKETRKPQENANFPSLVCRFVITRMSVHYRLTA